jgi:dienelactone hydrolase
MANPYLYVRQDNGFNFELKEETIHWSRYRVNLPSAQTAKLLEDNGIVGEYLLPKGRQRVPIAILVHGMAARSVTPCKLIANTLVKQGFACFILYLVFHDYRVRDSLRAKYPHLTSEEWFESYQISVTDIRQVIDWAENRSEIDSNKVAAIGISYGGFVSSIAMALDKRINAGILIVTGGNSIKIASRSLLLRLQYKYDKSEYLRNQQAYARYLKEVREKGVDNALADNTSYLTDPLTFSGYLRDRPLLMLNAHFDEIIPKAATLELWSGCGRPPIYWYPATHATIWAWYPLMSQRISRFLRGVFVT